ncbi:MAG: gluconate 2-dehydrogenase subunit 3 family protein [Halolamina sp.]
MELSRRDALAALSAAGVGSLAGCGAPEAATDGDAVPEREPEETPEAATLETLVAVAEVVYPEAATDGDGDPESFVRTYVAGRTADRPAYREGVVAATRELADVARDWEDAPFAELDPIVRDRLLRDLGVDTADPDPEGDVSSRLRYFVVNELLFAFYASPSGAELVGLENPAGHPGGTQSYQQPPPERFRNGGSSEATEPQTGTEAETDATDSGGDDG